MNTNWSKSDTAYQRDIQVKHVGDLLKYLWISSVVKDWTHTAILNQVWIPKNNWIVPEGQVLDLNHSIVYLHLVKSGPKWGQLLWADNSWSPLNGQQYYWQILLAVSPAVSLLCFQKQRQWLSKQMHCFWLSEWNVHPFGQSVVSSFSISGLAVWIGEACTLIQVLTDTLVLSG